MEVGAWLYDNFDIASGYRSCRSPDHTYQQAPYQDIDADEYLEWNGRVPTSLDWTKFSMYEKEDNTSGSRELACHCRCLRSRGLKCKLMIEIPINDDYMNRAEKASTVGILREVLQVALATL